MEHLNKIEIRGIIGSVYVKDYGNAKSANFSVATDYCYTSHDGSAVIETTWHYIIAWESENVKDLERLTPGATIHVIGRLRVRQRGKVTGEAVTVHDIIAHEVEIIEEN